MRACRLIGQPRSGRTIFQDAGSILEGGLCPSLALATRLAMMNGAVLARCHAGVETARGAVSTGQGSARGDGENHPAVAPQTSLPRSHTLGII